MGQVQLNYGPADAPKALRELGDHGDVGFYREMFEHRQTMGYMKMIRELGELMRAENEAEPLKKDAPA